MIIEKHTYVIKCDRCGKKTEYYSEGKLMHNYLEKNKLPKGFTYIEVDDVGYEPYSKFTYPIKKELLVCNSCTGE